MAPGVRASRLRPQGWLILVSVLMVVLVAAVAGAIRYGPMTAVGRDFIQAQAGGLKVGRLGRLRIVGLRGDLWSDFTLDRLQIRDGRGVWLDAQDLEVRWRGGELLDNRVHADLVTARTVTLIRRPVLAPKGAAGGSKVSIAIDRLATRLTMLPAFSMRLGVYDLTGAFDVERAGGGHAALVAAGVSHPGDFLRLFADVRGPSFVVGARASEAKGGALSGSVGLAPDQPFVLDAMARGSSSAGRFSLTSRVGADAPLAMAGAWTPLGGQALGTVRLSASTFLAPYQARLGPAAVFAVAGRRARAGFYGLGIFVRSQNATLLARGQADPGNRVLGPRGLALDLRVADAGRLFGVASVGPGRVTGGLGGDLGHWIFSGTAAAGPVAAKGYTLARLAGPVRLEARGGVLSLTASPRGAGGAGAGLAAALLGREPAGQIQADRLADGRLLLRRLTLSGVGLQLAASGERGLLGGLSLHGSANLSDLAAAHRGAGGVIKATWTAAQGSAAKPWSVTFDAGAERFAAGWAEIDRLLGPAPRLRVGAEISPGTVSIDHLTLDGAAGSLSAAGTVLAARTMALKLDWRAQGPFRAGPLEIAGAARGSGSLTGPIASPRADLEAAFDRVDLPVLPLEKALVRLGFAPGAGGGGHIAITGASPYGPAKGAAAFTLIPAGVELTDLGLAAAGVEAKGALSLRRGAPSSADLIFTVGPGVLLTLGAAHGRLQIVDAAAGAHAVVELSGAKARLRAGGPSIGSFELQGQGPLAHLPYVFSANGLENDSWRAAGAGFYASSATGQTLSFTGSGKARRVEFHTISPAVIRLGSPGASADLHLAVGGGRADVRFASAGAGLTANANINNFGLGLIDEDLVGRLDADVALAGAGPTLKGHGVARLTGAGGHDLAGEAPVDGAIKVDLAAGALAVTAAFANAQGLRATADLSLPAQTSAGPFRIALDRRAPLRGHFFVSGEAKPVWDLFMGGDRSLSGKMTAAGALAGTLSDPKAVGTAALDGGRFEDAQTGLRLENVFLRASLAGPAIDVAHLDAVDGAGGSVSGQGRISLERNGVSSFRLMLDHFRLIDNDVAQASASGAATVSRAANGRVKLSGALVVDKAQIAPRPPVPSGVVDMDVVEVHRPAAREDETVFARPPAPVALDIRLKAARGLFVKGRGLNVELSLDATVGGDTAAPILAGAARVVRGDYDFAGKRFAFDDRGSVRLGSRADLIRLDLTATREDPTLTAVIRIQGTAAKPEITLSSTPVLPADEVLSQVLFGASASQLNGLEAAQLASALSGLAGGGGFDVMGGLRTFAHLDRLAISGTPATGSSVVGGKYLRDNVYLELGGGGREGASAQVEWRVRKHLSIVSRLTGQGSSSLSVRWRKDY